MNMTLFYSFYGTMLLLVPLTIIYLILIMRLTRLLESAYPEEYRRVGAFSLWSNNTPSSSWRFLKFLFLREDKKLRDPQVSALTSVCLTLLVLALVASFFCMFVATFHWSTID